MVPHRINSECDSSSCDQRQYFFAECNNNTACNSQHAIGSLARIVRLERQADLEYTETEKNDSYCAYQGKNKV